MVLARLGRLVISSSHHDRASDVVFFKFGCQGCRHFISNGLPTARSTSSNRQCVGSYLEAKRHASCFAASSSTTLVVAEFEAPLLDGDSGRTEVPRATPLILTLADLRGLAAEEWLAAKTGIVLPAFGRSRDTETLV